MTQCLLAEYGGLIVRQSRFVLCTVVARPHWATSGARPGGRGPDGRWQGAWCKDFKEEDPGR